MTSCCILRRDINPTTDSSVDIKSSFCLTDGSGNSPSDPSLVTYLWLPQAAVKGDVICTYILSKITTRAMIYSDVNGFSIFNKNGTPEYSQGYNTEWARLAVTYSDGNITFLRGSRYELDLE